MKVQKYVKIPKNTKKGNALISVTFIGQKLPITDISVSKKADTDISKILVSGTSLILNDYKKLKSKAEKTDDNLANFQIDATNAITPIKISTHDAKSLTENTCVVKLLVFFLFSKYSSLEKDQEFNHTGKYIFENNSP